MPNVVFDTSFIALSNGDLAGRRKGNVMDRRLHKIERVANGEAIVWYNKRLLYEYETHLLEFRNDIVEIFIHRLADSGRRAARSTLSAVNYAKANAARWPAHDQHILAAAIEAVVCEVCVTEEALGNCANGIRRAFGVEVVRIA